MLNPAELAALLQPFDLRLTDKQIMQLQTYLEVLLRWNAKINLTAVRRPEECVTRHFGESLFLARWVRLEGRLLDIGSGAGFPGLALKIIFPDLAVTLLEPTTKKRAFLKEVARACEFKDVEFCGKRLEEFADDRAGPPFDHASSRAVGHFERLLSLTARHLKPGGRLYLWASRNQGSQLGAATDCFCWGPPIPIPLTRQEEIWQATCLGPSASP
jgi:16S rRNA (guanine527-N7)-methyltransferase